ncbi:hypothetical protein [Rhizobium sp. Root1220]|uniref:hypothetical protein n=1 Tax=Rhizobium sp. Root1220 TaxID=1736432 RepID=UPI0006F1FFD6|nr:hypothetical protein [Rhizobium sp. Root1220]KQV70320.1 hypothetical protein ASC90_09410 [Rhizobium sp. Root1220]
MSLYAVIVCGDVEEVHKSLPSARAAAKRFELSGYTVLILPIREDTASARRNLARRIFNGNAREEGANTAARIHAFDKASSEGVALENAIRLGMCIIIVVCAFWLISYSRDEGQSVDEPAAHVIQ